MNEERKYYLERYEQEREKMENTIGNAELCEKFSSHSTDDSDIIYWKKKGLEIREKVYGKKSLQLGKYYDSLAELCVNCGKYKLAKSMCDKSINVKLLDDTGQSNLLKTYEIMISIYDAMDDYENGIKCGEEALSLKEVKNQNNYNEVITINKYLSWIFNRLKDEDKRDYHINQALNISVNYFGENSFQAAEIYVEKARFQLKERKEKLELFKKALIIFYENFGFNDRRATRVYRFIWNCWEGNPAESIELANDWLEKNIPKDLYHEIKKWRK
ncbi:hypothetical protein SAMN02745136_04555 [Anaerocolumna jejuensis DSM 15929]|uniref:Tetratricopeptide repeat-containing protein n=1 Tax=Anaerocolumna jejuensis DSM 15929 TaxID=1121322 RepID=A0A1M6ZG14_9FIRM|nr:hypothetical protein [Anaerocolumna jejuensis]SHL29422.1 hypothetical protein SAMN02745136_04555 [Anaerocolumna jejuensis DSM 15929]